jgi:hypothetical protein
MLQPFVRFTRLPRLRGSLKDMVPLLLICNSASTIKANRKSLRRNQRPFPSELQLITSVSPTQWSDCSSMVESHLDDLSGTRRSWPKTIPFRAGIWGIFAGEYLLDAAGVED